MKLRLQIIILFLLAVGASTNILAQTLNSSYFLEGATFRHQLNPAFMGERNYISIPLLGNINVGTSSNIGLTDFIYKYNDPESKYDLTTFMSSSVSREEFLGNLKTNNQINTNFGFTILSAGFHAWGGFNTIELGVKSNSSVNLPYELFNFMKTGMDQEVYHIKNFAANSNNYVELALGHAHDINDRLTIGAKLKFLVGGANVDSKIDQMDVELTGDKWQIMANGTINTAVGGGYYKTKAENPGEITGFDVEKNAGPAGYGAGIDLGATYKIGDNFILSASVLDLGFINWKNSLKGATHNNEPFTFNGFNNIAVDPEDGDPNSVDEQFENMKDDLEDMTKFYDEGKVNRTTTLASTVNFGAEYLFFNDKMSLGALTTTHINKPYTWSQAMAALNMRPARWLDASVNYSYSTFGSNLGWMLNIHPKGFTFFVGSDRMITNVTPQYIPTNNFNTNICFGFNITFGRCRN
jgi:hypothetical protein